MKFFIGGYQMFMRFFRFGRSSSETQSSISKAPEIVFTIRVFRGSNSSDSAEFFAERFVSKMEYRPDSRVRPRRRYVVHGRRSIVRAGGVVERIPACLVMYQLGDKNMRNGNEFFCHIFFAPEKSIEAFLCATRVTPNSLQHVRERTLIEEESITIEARAKRARQGKRV